MTFADWMYERIPGYTRARDAAEGYPLRQLVAVLAVSATGLKEDAEKLLLLTDPETCPEAMLPRLGAMLGFEFPYDLSVAQQRAFVKFMVDIYRIKGTPNSLRSVASRLIGNGFDLEVVGEDVAAHTFEYIVVSNAGGTLGEELQDKLIYLLNSVTPAGLIPTLTLAFFFEEEVPAGHASDIELADRNFELTSYKTNVASHTTNGVVKLSTIENREITL